MCVLLLVLDGCSHTSVSCRPSPYPCRGKLPSTQMHILSLERISKGQSALHLSVPMPFAVWDHAACVLPALPGLRCGCIVVVGGRVQAQQGFSEAIHVIDLDPRSCYAVRRARIRCRSASASVNWSLHITSLAASIFPQQT